MTENTPSRYWMIFCFIAVLLIAFPVLKADAWSYTESSFDMEMRSAMIATVGDWNPYLEITGTFHGNQGSFRYASLTAGSYYRALPWLKVGGFYRLQTGARHIEDWNVALPDNHSWEDTTGRFENLLLLDATPRFLMPFIPGENWVAPLKLRYSYNLSNNHQSLLVRPGLTYVLMVDRSPRLNLSVSYNFYFALNYGELPLYSHGPYLTVLGHINDWFKLEGRVKYTKTSYLKYDFGGSWSLSSHHIVLGIGAIFTPR